jgi:hypothetical protein
MIFLDSRYSDATISKVYDSRNGSYQLTAFRVWPSATRQFFYHEWKETDRIDELALRNLGKSSLWWAIMDINPELIDPLSIPPGTLVRIPRG